MLQENLRDRYPTSIVGLLCIILGFFCLYILIHSPLAHATGTPDNAVSNTLANAVFILHPDPSTPCARVSGPRAQKLYSKSPDL